MFAFVKCYEKEKMGKRKKWKTKNEIEHTKRKDIVRMREKFQCVAELWKYFSQSQIAGLSQSVAESAQIENSVKMNVGRKLSSLYLVIASFLVFLGSQMNRKHFPHL